jgi:2-keto-3-deoxy-L-rhamnonate aldolase RhmA
MLGINKLKVKINEGKPVLGVWNTLASPLVTEVIAQSGLDFQIIDLEHGPFILDKVNLHVSACENASSCTPLVRIPSNQDWMSLQALDQGAHGVVVPHISNSKEAKELVRTTKYYPSGERGFTPFSKAGGFNNKNTSSYVKNANNSTLLVVIIESQEGLENLDEIVAVEGVDIIYFGAYDLSQALGCPGEVRNPKLINSIKQGVDIVNANGKCAGGFVPQSKDDIKWALDMGMRFVTYQVDSSIIYNHVSSIADWFDDQVIR